MGCGTGQPAHRQGRARGRGVGHQSARARLKRICRSADFQSAVSQNCILRRYPVAPTRNRPVFPVRSNPLLPMKPLQGLWDVSGVAPQGRPPMRPTAGLDDEISSGFGIAGLLKQQSRMRDAGNGKNVPVPAFPQCSTSCSRTFNLPLFFASLRLGVRFCISVRLRGGLSARIFPPCAARNFKRWKTEWRRSAGMLLRADPTHQGPVETKTTFSTVRAA